MKNQKIKQKLAKLLVACLILSCLVSVLTLIPSASADTVYTEWGSEYYSGNSWTLQNTHPTGSSAYSAGAESFTLTEAQAITKVSVYMYYPTASSSYDNGIINASIMAGGGSIPASAQGYLEVSSTQYDYTELSHSEFLVYDFVFSGSTYEAGTYWLCIYNTVYAGGVGYGARLGYDSGGTYAGNHSSYYNSAWISRTGDLCFYVYTDTPGATPTPTPTPPPSVPEGFSSCTFGVEPDGLVTWSYGDPENPEYVWIGHVGLTYTNPNTWQIMDGTQLTVTAYPPNASYAFDHWEATTGEYNFNITVSPLFFTVEADFTLTAICVPIEETNSYIVTFPATAGGVIGVSYNNETSWDFSDQTYTMFIVQGGTLLTFHAVPNSGYSFSSLIVEPANTSIATQVYASDTVAVIIEYDCSVYGVFTATGGGSSGGADNINDVIDAIIANLNVLIYLTVIFIFGVLGYGFAGAWGFFAGINLAVIMLYIFGSLPLWVVIAMIILDSLMFYGKAQIGKGKKGNAAE